MGSTDLDKHRFRGQVAVVTGGSRGIGRGIAVALAAEGAEVVITGTDAVRTDAAAAQIAAETGQDVIGRACNVADESDVSALADHVNQLHGRVDVLINNAAIARRNPVIAISTAEWNEVYAVNVTGTFLAVRECR